MATLAATEEILSQFAAVATFATKEEAMANATEYWFVACPYYDAC
jgi:hypothetical protein